MFSKLSTTRAGFELTQIQEDSAQQAGFAPSTDTISLRRVVALEVTLLVGLQKAPTTASSAAHNWPLIYVKLRHDARSCHRMGSQIVTV